MVDQFEPVTSLEKINYPFDVKTTKQLYSGTFDKEILLTQQITPREVEQQ